MYNGWALRQTTRCTAGGLRRNVLLTEHSIAYFTTKNNYVTFNELSPGKYTFEVRVIDTGGNKSEASSVTFTIKPPFLRSSLAIFIYILIAILFVIKSKYEVKKLERLVKERTKDLEEENILVIKQRN